MHAEIRLLAGLLIAHLLWALAYLAGTLLDPRAARPATRATALLDLVVRSAAGLALLGFAAFALAQLGILDRWSLAGLGLALVLAGRLVHGPAFFTRAFWAGRAASVGLAFGRAELILYYAVLAAIVLAAYPDNTSDGVRYHLAYAMDWANHGDLFVDRFLRQPLYANNFLLIFSVFDVLGLAAYATFATWLCGALAVLAVRAFLLLADDAAPAPVSAFARFSRRAVTLVLPLTIVVPAVFLRYLGTGMVDVPMELYAFVPALCAAGALLAKRDLLWSAVCCGAFAIGMKISLIALAPLFLVTVWIAAGAAGRGRRAALSACAVLLLLSAPWYVRNLIYDHDPIPPLVNLALNHPDLTYTPEDARSVLTDIKPDRSLSALVALPYRMWADPLNLSLREYGSVALELFLYVPLVAAAAGLALGVRSARKKALMLMCGSAAYLLAYCLLTSYLMRYLLIIQPALAASVGALLLAIPELRYAAALRAALAAVTILPTPGAFGFYHYVYEVDYKSFEPRLSSDDAFLRQTLAAYPEAVRLLATPAFRRRPAPRVLLVHAEVEYYLRRDGVQTVGDWFGPGRFADLKIALENDRLPDYVRYFDVGGVIFKRADQRFFDRGDFAALERGLRRLGFTVLEDDPNGYFVAVRSEAPRP